MCLFPVYQRRNRKEVRLGISLEPPAQIRCGKCPPCLKERKNDVVGRALAETEDCKSYVVMTFTYGKVDGLSDHDAARNFNHRHMKKCIDAMRRKYPLRFLYVAERGDANGRCHFHAVIWHTSEKTPEYLTVHDSKVSREALDGMAKQGRWALNRRIHIPEWPHGFVFIQRGMPDRVRYVCKYLTKTMGPTTIKERVHCSVNPPMGAGYFQRLAEMHVQQGLAPKDGIFSPAGSEFTDPRWIGVHKGQKAWRYRIHGGSKRRYVEHFRDRWAAVHPEREMPTSPWLEKALEAAHRHHQRRANLRKVASRKVLLEIQEKAARRAAKDEVVALHRRAWREEHLQIEELATSISIYRAQAHLDEACRLAGDYPAAMLPVIEAAKRGLTVARETFRREYERLKAEIAKERGTVPAGPAGVELAARAASVQQRVDDVAAAVELESALRTKMLDPEEKAAWWARRNARRMPARGQGLASRISSAGSGTEKPRSTSVRPQGLLFAPRS